LSHTAVTKVIVRYEDEGAAVLAPRKQGRRSGEHRALTAEQEDAVRRIICDKRPEAVQAWLDEQYPEIGQRAKTVGAEIHWGDETALVNTDLRRRSYAPAGKTPVA